MKGKRFIASAALLTIGGIWQIPQPVLAESDAISMHRLYNPNSGEHFYTGTEREFRQLVCVGWKDEGIGWKAPARSDDPVYRLYNPNAGDHHYTRNKVERDRLIQLGWKDEGVGWYSEKESGTPVYRQYNPNAVSGAHNYTIKKEENDFLEQAGWNPEGIGWYGCAGSEEKQDHQLIAIVSQIPGDGKPFEYRDFFVGKDSSGAVRIFNAEGKEIRPGKDVSHPMPRTDSNPLFFRIDSHIEDLHYILGLPGGVSAAGGIGGMDPSLVAYDEDSHEVVYIENCYAGNILSDGVYTFPWTKYEGKSSMLTIPSRKDVEEAFKSNYYADYSEWTYPKQKYIYNASTQTVSGPYPDTTASIVDNSDIPILHNFSEYYTAFRYLYAERQPDGSWKAAGNNLQSTASYDSGKTTDINLVNVWKNGTCYVIDKDVNAPQRIGNHVDYATRITAQNTVLVHNSETGEWEVWKLN